MKKKTGTDEELSAVNAVVTELLNTEEIGRDQPSFAVWIAGKLLDGLELGFVLPTLWHLPNMLPA